MHQPKVSQYDLWLNWKWLSYAKLHLFLPLSHTDSPVTGVTVSDDSYTPVDQVSQMENSQQSVGSRAQNPLPEELGVNLFIARGEGIFPRVAFGWASPVTHVHLHKGDALHRRAAARLCYISSTVCLTLHFPISCYAPEL